MSCTDYSIIWFQECTIGVKCCINHTFSVCVSVQISYPASVSYFAAIEYWIQCCHSAHIEVKKCLRTTQSWWPIITGTSLDSIRDMNFHWLQISIRLWFSCQRYYSRCISVYSILSDLYSCTWPVPSFNFPFYSKSSSNTQTTAIYKIKAASFWYINITKTKPLSFCSAYHVCCNLQWYNFHMSALRWAIYRLCCTRLSQS